MSEMPAVRCESCGGAVAVDPGAPLPACLFCGADARDLAPYDPPESIEDPQGAIPFSVTEQDAQGSFATFARSSFWYPRDLRDAKLALRRLQLPAWAWSGRLETHWTGLVSASTQSGKRPVSGQETVDFEQVLVPASASLTLRELSELGRYDEGALAPFEPSDGSDPYELSEVTRSAARQAAQGEMERRHTAALAKEASTLVIRAASVCLELDGRPVLVPVYIGAYRYGDGLYRVLVNGQTGKLIGTAPISWMRVGCAVAAGLALVALVAVLVSLCAGGGAFLSQL